MDKKYELVKDTSIDYRDHTLYRIKALKDFGEVKKGDLGGYVESEKNLSQKENCWISGDAKVYDNAEVFDNAKVYDDVLIYGNADVYGNAEVFGNARVSSDARVSGNAGVYDNALVHDNAEVYGNAEVYNKAEVYGNAWVHGYAEITHNAQIKSSYDYLVFKNTWSSGRNFTYTKSNKMWKVGCFYGTGEELVAKAYKDSKESGDKYRLYVDLVNNL